MTTTATDTPIYSDDRKILLTDAAGSYNPWEFRMRASARAKKLLSTIQGQDDEPTTGHSSKTWKTWRARQDAAADLIIKGLDDSQITYVRGLENDPEAMWEKLRSMHEPVGLGGATGLWIEFFSMMYDGVLPMKTFLGRITGIGERLERNYQTKPSDEQTIAKMLSALPTEYSGIYRTLNGLAAPDLTLDTVQRNILMEDITVCAEKAKKGEVVFNGSTALKANSDVTCENCNVTGHTKARCWHEGGDMEGQYPDWWLGKRTGTSSALVPATHMARVL